MVTLFACEGIALAYFAAMNRLIAFVIVFASTLHAQAQSDVDESMATTQIIILGEVDDYHDLHTSLDSLSLLTGMHIDPLGRGWNNSDESLTLPIDDSDGLYASFFSSQVRWSYSQHKASRVFSL